MKIITAETHEIILNNIINEVSKKSMDNDRNFILVVPEKLSLTVEQALLNGSTKKAVTNVQVLTLSRLLKRFVKSNDNYLPKESGVMIIKKIIIENQSKLVCFNKTAKTIGFAEKIFDTISNLKNSGVTPDDFLKRANNKVCQSLKVKMQDILLLYSEYQNYIETNGLIDASDRFLLLANLVKNSELIKSSDCYIFGFDNITRSGLEVLKALSKCAKTCTFGAITNVGLNNSYIIEPEMLNSVRAFCAELKIPVTEVEIKDNSTSINSHIRRNLFAYPYSKMKIENEINIIECKNITEEVSFVAEVIRKNVIKKKQRYRDYFVACSDIDSYAKVIKTVFDEYNIPVYIEKPEKLSSHALVQFISQIFHCVRRHFLISDCLALSKNYFAGENLNELNIFENYCIKYGINYDKFKKPFEYGEDKTPENPITDKVIAEKIRVSLIQKLIKVADKLAEGKTVHDYVLAINYIFECFNLKEKLNEFITELENSENNLEAELSKQVLEKYMGVLSEIDRIMGDIKLSLDEFYGILSSGVDSQTISLIPVFVDSVFVGDASTSKFVAPKNLFVIGATDGAMPKLVEDCGIIVDSEIGELSSGIGKKIEPTIKTINKRERYKFLSLLASFGEKMYVTYPKMDAGLTEQNPSLAVLDLKKIFYKSDDPKECMEIMSLSSYRRRRSLFREDDKETSFAYEFSTPRVAYKKLLNYLNDENTSTMLDTVPVVSNLFYALKGLKVCDEASIKPILPKLNRITAPQEFFFPNKTTSISQLEAYFTCPFKFFANYGLKIREREESLLKSIDFGNILHKIAELYVKNIEMFLKEQNLVIRKRKIENLINRVFDAEKLAVAKNKHIVASLKNEAKRLIDALTYQYSVSNFKPKYEEFVFGEKGKVKGLDLGNGIKLEGKVDRIDLFKDNFRVIDYKTGKIDLQAKNVYYGNKIQLFMYLNALKSKKIKPVGAFYLPIKNVFVEEELGTFLSTYKLQGYFVDDCAMAKNMDIQLNANNLSSNCLVATLKPDRANKETDNLILRKQNHILSEQEFDGVLDYCMQLSKGAVKEIMSGYIEKSPIKTAEKPACIHCEYKNCCGNSKSQVKPRSTESVTFSEFAFFKERNNGTKAKKWRTKTNSRTVGVYWK